MSAVFRPLDTIKVVVCTPDEWVTDRQHHDPDTAVRLVKLTAVPDGAPWNDEYAPRDPVTGRFSFAPWPGIEFELPLDD